MTDLSVMTWNVENLFPPGVKTSFNAKAPVSQQDFEAKVNFLAEHIADISPDIVALQEIGGRTNDDTFVLDTLLDALEGEYTDARVAMPDGRRIKVAFLSKMDLDAVEDISDFPEGPFDSLPNHPGRDPIDEMGRGALKVEVDVGGTRIRLITLHLKSKLLTYPRNGGTSFSTNDENLRTETAGIALLKRTAEAVTVRTLLNGVMESAPDTRTIVLGDFNDDPRAATSQIFLGPTDADIMTADSKDHVRLYNLTDSVPLRGTEIKSFLPETERFTRIHEGRGEVLDQIMASRNLTLRHGVFRVLEVRSFVHLIEGQSVSDDPNDRIGEAASDHSPVVATFDV